MADLLPQSFEFRLPTIDDVMRQSQALAPQPTALPFQPVANLPEAPKRNLFAAGLSAGVDELQGIGGALASQVGKLTGISPLEQWGAEVAARNAQEAQDNGRPDLEIAPWKEGGASVLPWLAYQTLKQVPQIGAAIAGGALVPQAAVPAALARFGAAVPGVLGGGRGLATEAALQAGTRYGQTALASIPISSGSLYGSALDRARDGGEAPSYGEALGAAALSPAYAALEAFEPRGLMSLAERGAKGNLAKRVATGFGVGAATEAPVEGVQTAMELMFRPDMSFSDKAEQIFDAAITGGAVGGTLRGGVGAFSKTKTDPTMPTEAVKEKVDEQLLLTGPREPQLTLPAPEQFGRSSAEASPAPLMLERPGSGPTMFSTPNGQVAQNLYEADNAANAAATAAPPSSIAERFADVSDQDLSRMRALVEQDMSARGPQSQFEMQQLRELRAEEERRAQGRPVEPVAPMSLFNELDAVQRQAGQPVEEPSVARATRANVNEQREKVLSLLDGVEGRAQIARKINAETEEQLYREVADKMANPGRMSEKALAGFTTLAERLGLTDKKGRPINYDRQIAKAEDTLLQAELADRTGGTPAVPVAKAREDLAALQQRAALVRSILEPDVQQETGRGGSGPVGQEAPSVVASPPSPQTELPLSSALPVTESVQPQPRPAAPLGPMTVPNEVPPVNTSMQAILKPAQQAVNANLAEQQQAEQVAAAQQQAYTEAQIDQPVRLATVDQVTGNPVMDAARVKTVEGFNRLTREQQNRILDREEFANDPRGPEAAVLEYIAKAPSQPQARSQLERIAGVERGTFDAAPAKTSTLLRRTANPSAPAMSQAAFDNALARTLSKLTPERAATVQVVNTAQDLPASVLAKAAEDKVPLNEIHGVYDKGEVYIVRENTKTAADVQEAVLHEVLGHQAARSAYGDNFNDTMLNVFEKAGGVDGLRDLAKKYKVEEQFAKYIPEDTSKMSEAEKVSLADELLAQAAGKATGKFSTMLREWAGKIKQALLSAMRGLGMNDLASRFDKMSALDVARMMGEMRQAALNTQNNTDTAFSIKPAKTVQQAEQVAASVVSSINEALDKGIDRLQAKSVAFKQALGFFSLHHLAQKYNGLMKNTISPIEDAMDYGRTISSVLSNLNVIVSDGFERVRKNAQADQRMGELIAATAQNVRPGLAWQQQTWLHKEPNAAELKELVTKSNENLRWLTQKGFADVYENARDSNKIGRFAPLTHFMQMLAAQNDKTKDLPGLKLTSVDQFFGNPDQHNDVKGSKDWWEAEFTKTLKAAQEFVKSDKSFPELTSAVEQAQKAYSRMQQGDYFPLSRFGNYYVSMSVGGEKTAPDRGNLQKLSDTLYDNNFEVVIPVEAGTNRVFIRVETLGEQARLKALMDKLGNEGVVNEIQIGNKKDNPEAYRSPSNVATQLADQTIASMQRTVDAIQDPARKEEAKKILEKTADTLKSAALELEPDMSLKLYLAQRKGVSGFSANYQRNYAHRNQVGNSAFANMVISPRIAKATSDMNLATRAEQDVVTRDKMSRIRDEINLRLALRSDIDARSVLESIRSLSYVTIMSSPSTAVLQLSSLGMMVLPELAKTSGFVNSAKAMARSTGDAFKIMNAIVAHSSKGGIHRTPDIVFNAESIKNANVPQAVKDFVAKMAVSIELGAPTREMGRLASGKGNSKLDTAMRYAGFMTAYTEAFSRLVTALTVRELNGDKPETITKAKGVIADTLFNFNRDNVARQFSQSGFAGQATPLVTQFQQFNFQTAEKLFREFDKAFTDRAATAEEKTEARKFLNSMLAMTVVHAGVLGLPMAAVFARVLEGVLEATGGDDEPVDVNAMVRNFLSDTFGKDMGEILARGVSRGAGFDISSRTGLQNIIPFSQFLTDRRKLEDRFDDLAKDSMGPAFGVAAGFIMGMRDISDGKWLNGLKQMVPNAIRGPLDAGYMLTEDAYVNKQGQKLPLTPTAADIMYQALGFKPSQKAEYDEALKTMRTRQGLLGREAGGFREEGIKAFQADDRAALKDVIQRASKFDQNQPAYASLPTLGNAITKAEVARETARATGTAMGTKLKDVQGVQQQRFANF